MAGERFGQQLTPDVLAVKKGGTGLGDIPLGSVLAANTLDVFVCITETTGISVLRNDAGVISWGDLTGLSIASHVLDDHADVEIEGTYSGGYALVADNEMLCYDAGTGQWINMTKTEAGFGSAAVYNVGTLAGDLVELNVSNQFDYTYLPIFIGDDGNPGTSVPGIVPAAAQNDYSAGKYFDAGGNWSVPAASGTGEVNTASNQGGFYELFIAKVSLDLQFRTVQSSDGSVTFTENTNDLDIIVYHEDLTDLIGGNASGHYHLSGSQYNTLTSSDGSIDNADGEHTHGSLVSASNLHDLTLAVGGGLSYDAGSTYNTLADRELTINWELAVVPLICGVAALGTATTLSRSDHVHPVNALGDLSNVTLGGMALGDVLTYSAGVWINLPISSVVGYWSRTSTYLYPTTAGDSVWLKDSEKLLLGTGMDGEIYSSSDDLIILNTTDSKDIIFMVEKAAAGSPSEFMRLNATGPYISLNEDLFTDRWLNSDTNFFLGIDVAGADTLAHTTGLYEGWYNLGIGNKALYSITTGNLNVCIGFEAGYSITSGTGHVCIGYQAGKSLNTATSVYGSAVFIGYRSGMSSTIYTISNANVGIGGDSLQSLTTGYANVAIGWNSDKNNQTGHDNVCIGAQAGQGVAGQSHNYNIAIGGLSLSDITTGTGNIVMGYSAFNALTSGAYNIGIGYKVGYIGTTARWNIFMGYQAGYDITSAEGNVMLGYESGTNVTDGAYNVAIGYHTGLTLTTGDYNILIGAFADVDAAGDSYKLKITGINAATNVVDLISGNFDRNAADDTGQVVINDVLKLVERSAAPGTPQDGEIWKESDGIHAYIGSTEYLLDMTTV